MFLAFGEIMARIAPPHRLRWRQSVPEMRSWQRPNPKTVCEISSTQFQWLTAEQSERPNGERRARIEAELADILIYVVRLADRLDIDLPAAVTAKIEQNRRKYPAELVRGSARKYDEYP